MGREIRRVPPNYEHPKRYCRHHPSCEEGEYPKCYQPQYDEYFEDAYAEWLSDFKRIKSGGLTEEEKKYYANLKEWLEENPQRDLSYYRTYTNEEASWYQVFQTVSEGSPVTPPFETEAELVDYLVKHGDFWYQKHGDRPYTKEEAEAFVYGDGWVPSMVIMDGILTQGIQSAPLFKLEQSPKLGIDVNTLTPHDIGKWVVYHDLLGKTEEGKIKSWNSKFIHVVFKCDNNWHKFQDYTAEACDPNQLAFKN